MEETWRYLVTVKFAECMVTSGEKFSECEAILGEFDFMPEALKLVEEVSRAIRLYGDLSNVLEFRIIPFLEEKGEEDE
ncbi:MAG: hypothetical protein QW692_00525 [Nitrososphaerota archaeon]